MISLNHPNSKTKQRGTENYPACLTDGGNEAKKSVSDLPRAMFLAVEVLVWKGSWGVSIQTSLQSRNPLLELL